VTGDLLITGASHVATCAGPGPRRGAALDDAGVREGVAIRTASGLIAAIGPEAELRAAAREDLAAGRLTELSVGGRAIVPGFVDAHTHAVFAGNRAREFEMRLRGRTYLEILEAGGGILDTVDRVRAAGHAGLLAESAPRLARMLALGTTTAEVKSGYGLSLESELTMLEVIRDLDRTGPLALVPTFLGAHACPRGADRDAYAREVAQVMMPRVASRGLARFVDVFCDAGAFDVAQARLILDSARAHGLGLKLHADEIKSIGATPLGVELGCTSLDHLEKTTPEDVRRLADSRTVAVLLPGTAFVLALGFPPARAMIEAGVAVALATDCNPGSCYTESMPLIQMLACCGMRMTPAEALVASTINGAAALGIADRCGSLEPGKQADLLVLESADFREIAYHFGPSPVRAVIRAGKLVHGEV
jgi:imidazolonepropionase